MTGQIPKYGANFRRESVRYEPDLDLAHTIYVLKANSDWWLRANKNSERWWIFCHGRIVGGPFDTMTEAMAACVPAVELLRPPRCGADLPASFQPAGSLSPAEQCHYDHHSRTLPLSMCALPHEVA